MGQNSLMSDSCSKAYFHASISYSCDFHLDSEVIERFVDYVQRMVRDPMEPKNISFEILLYRRVVALFGYDMEVEARKFCYLARNLNYTIQCNFFCFLFQLIW
jgi:hypothetical protein